MANGTEITTTKARPRLGFSSQAKWAKLQQAKGNCRICGNDRRTPAEIEAGVPAKLKQNCRSCQDKVTIYMRSYRAQKKLAAATQLNQNNTTGNTEEKGE